MTTHATSGSDAASDDLDDVVELVLPADLERAPMLRLVCAHLGSEAGFTLDDVDDLRLVATEVFSSVVADPEAVRVSISFRADDDSVSARFVAIGATSIQLDDLAAQILRSGVDEVAIDGPLLRFVKRAGSDADR